MIEVWADGSVRDGNPGIGGIAIYVRHNDRCVYEHSWLLPSRVTNNEAEYEAVLAALVYLEERSKYFKLEKEKCIIITDSKLVHGHVIKNWKCNFAHLRFLRDEVKGKLEKLPFKVDLRLMGREHNEIANELAQTITQKEKERLYERFQ